MAASMQQCSMDAWLPQFLYEAAFPLLTHDVASLCGVTIATARRWIAGEVRPPPAALALLKIHATRDLGEIDAAWRGWRLLPGGLTPPDMARGFPPGAVAALPYVYALNAEYARQLKKPRQFELFGDATPLHRAATSGGTSGVISSGDGSPFSWPSRRRRPS